MLSKEDRIKIKKYKALNSKRIKRAYVLINDLGLIIYRTIGFDFYSVSRDQNSTELFAGNIDELELFLLKYWKMKAFL